MRKGTKIDNNLIWEKLVNVKNEKSYYAGGTLCIDLEEEKDTLMINLDGTWFLLSGKIKNEKLLYRHTKLAFEIYKENKGETEYYKEKLAKFGEILLDKEYNWEESYDLGRDVSESIENLSEEFEGTIQVTIKYIPNEKDNS